MRAAATSTTLILLLASALPPVEAAPPAPSPLAAEPLCYQQLSGAPSRRSIEQLRLQRTGQRITGSYAWIPWQKDRRLGRLEGVEGPAGTARLSYRYSQEGQTARAALTVVFDARQATIHWAPAGAQGQGQPQPPVRLPRSACSALQPIPRL